VTILQARITYRSYNWKILSEIYHFFDHIFSNLLRFGHLRYVSRELDDEFLCGLPDGLVVLLDLLGVELEEGALRPDLLLGLLLLDHAPQLLEGPHVQLELLNVRVLSGRVVQIHLHIVDLLHFLVQSYQFCVYLSDFLVILVFKTFVGVLSEFFKFTLNFVKTLLEGLFLVSESGNDLLSVKAKSFFLLVYELLDFQDLVVSRFNGFNLILLNLQAGIGIEEAKPVNEVVILSDYLIALKKLEIFEFTL
jgi:hypothetical protein